MTVQTSQGRGQTRSAAWASRAKSLVPSDRSPFVFNALVVFSFLYYYRPEDYLSFLVGIPMARVAAVLALVALIVGMSGGKVKMPAAVKILWLLLLQMTLCIPFAMWMGGAFHTVYEKFAKGVIVAMLISMAVVTVRELRRLIWIQVSAVALVTFFSIALRHYNKDGRLQGIQKSILENPNDLAINIAISFPLGLAFMLSARGFWKVIWALALAVMSLGLVLTYSRSGLLAFMIVIIVCVWEYGIKGKRRSLVIVTAITMILGMCAALSTSHYRARVASIVMGNIEGSGDKGSLDARKALLKKSIMLALNHPIFGVGPGCFVLVDKGWVVAHNSYTELAAEAGIPALVLFLMSIFAAFRNVGLIRKSQLYEDDPEVKLFTQALWAGLAAYLAGACFASTEYNLYPYFMVGYTCAMVRIVSQSLPAQAKGSKKSSLVKTNYDRFRRTQPVGSR
jgi:O-antigen ligase